MRAGSIEVPHAPFKDLRKAVLTLEDRAPIATQSSLLLPTQRRTLTVLLYLTQFVDLFVGVLQRQISYATP